MAEPLTSPVEVYNGLPFRRDNGNGAYVLFADAAWHQFPTVEAAKAQIDVISPRMDAADKANLLYIADTQANTDLEGLRADQQWADEQREIEPGAAQEMADFRNHNETHTNTQECEATPMATATAVTNDSISASFNPAVVFPPETIVGENSKWYEQSGGVNQLSADAKVQAQKDYDAYLKTDTVARLDRYPSLDRYVAARQGMNEDLRTAKHAINEYAAQSGTLGGTLSAIRTSDPEKLYFAFHSHLKAVEEHSGKDSARYAMLAELDKPLREDMLTKQAKGFKPGAWQLGNDFASLSPEQHQQATKAWEAMKSRGGKGADQSLEKFVTRTQADVKRRRAFKPVEKSFEYKPKAVNHWQIQKGGLDGLNDTQRNAAEKAYALECESNPKLAEKTSFAEFVEERQASRANNDAIMAKVSHVFENPEAVRKTLTDIYGPDAAKNLVDSMTNAAQPGKVNAGKVLNTFTLFAEKVDDQVRFVAVPKPGKVHEMNKLLQDGVPVVKEQNQQKEGPEPTAGKRQKTQRRSRERTPSR